MEFHHISRGNKLHNDFQITKECNYTYIKKKKIYFNTTKRKSFKNISFESPSFHSKNFQNRAYIYCWSIIVIVTSRQKGLQCTGRICLKRQLKGLQGNETEARDHYSNSRGRISLKIWSPSFSFIVLQPFQQSLKTYSASALQRLLPTGNNDYYRPAITIYPVLKILNVKG